MRRRLTPFLALALGAVSASAAAESLPVRDQNPLTRAAYLPLAATAPSSTPGWSFSAALDWSNTVNLGLTPAEQMTVDEETIETDLTATREAGDWRFRATLPVIHRGAGVLDGFIDGWHRFFGLPQGDRPNVPKNAYAIRYARQGAAPLDVPSGTALGDLSLEAGRVLATGGEASLTAWAGVAAPTGSRSRLTSDGALDEALWVEGEAPLSGRWSVSGRAGLSHPGGDAGLPFARAVGFGTVGVSYLATARLEGVVQFDAHSRIARDSHLNFLGEAVELTIGGRYRLASGAVFEAGVVEDIEVDHSPDVTFHFGWRFPIARAAR